MRQDEVCVFIKMTWPCLLVIQPTTMQNVTNMLHLALKEEKAKWKPYTYHINSSVEQGVEIGGEDRDIAIRWLLKLNSFLSFSHETLFSAVSIIDQFFHAVKAHPKYLYCIAIACFYIAIKLTEEDEIIPTARQLLDVSGSICNVSELQRMECTILKKINWNLKRVTSLNFLHIFYRLMMLHYPTFYEETQMNSNKFLLWLVIKLKSTLMYYSCAAFRPSTLALSLFSIGLELSCKTYLPFMSIIQNLFKVSYKEFLVCRKELSCIIYSVCEPINIPNNVLSVPTLLNKHKVNQPDVDDIYDSIKDLYREDKPILCSAALQDFISSATDCKLMPVTAN